ncbi:reverse transcriptase domain-containing protein [Tanacetum coccineum]
MNERCSAVLLNKLPSKEKDPGSFTIPCDIGHLHINNALAYLGASLSLMPYTMYEKLGLGEPKPTRVSLELVDRSIQYPRGITEDMLIKIDKFVLLIDFVILDIREDYRIPIILGRPFLATARAMIDDNECYRIYDLDTVIQSAAQEPLENENLEDGINRPDSKNHGSNSEIPIRRIDHINTPYSQETQEQEETLSEHLYSASVIKINKKKPELKDLPFHLEYTYLKGDESCLVIISSKLTEKEKTSLLRVLEKRKGAIAWKMSYIKGISLSVCAHKILMEESFKSVIQPQRRLNPKVLDVVKDEIVRLLNSGLIYPISDSPWMLERLSRNEYYCFLDGFSGFFQISIALEDQEKTTFTSPYGTFAYRRMPFGLCNAPTTLQRCMTAIFHDMDAKPRLIGWVLLLQGFNIEIKNKKGGENLVADHLSRLENPNIRELAEEEIEDKFPDEHLMILKTKLMTKNHDALLEVKSLKYWHTAILVQPRDIIVLQLQIKDKKGAENLAADHLSRLENPNIGEIVKEEIKDKFPDEHLMILKTKLNDEEPWYADYVNYIVGKVVPTEWTPEKKKRFFSQVKNYFWDEPYAFRICPDNVMRRCIAGSEILKILAHCHSGLTGGHHSALVTGRKVYEAGFYWPSMFRDAKDYVMKCNACRKSRNISSRNKMPQNIIQVCEVFDIWGLDFMGPFPDSRGNKYILVTVDYVSKWVKAQALPINDACVVVKFLKGMFARFKVPKALINDRGTHFCNSQLEKDLLRYGVTRRISIAYHPQTNGQTKVTNRAIKCILERSVRYNPKDWSEKLNDALWAFKTAYKTPTGCNLFRMVYGKACHLPVKIEHKSYWALKQYNMDITVAAKNCFMKLNELMELRDGAYENTRIYKERTKKWHDSRFRGDKDFKNGDKVLLFNSRLKLHPGKLKSKWIGPFVVKTIYPYGAVEITDNDGSSFKVNRHRLKKIQQ